MEGFKADGWCGGFIVVDPPVLSEALGNISDLVMYNFTCVVALLLANKLTLEGVMAMWDFQAGHKDKDLEVFKTL